MLPNKQDALKWAKWYCSQAHECEEARTVAAYIAALIKPEERKSGFQALLDQLNQRLPLWQNNRDAREAITPILQMAEMADLVRDAMRYRALRSVSGVKVLKHVTPRTPENIDTIANDILEGKI